MIAQGWENVRVLNVLIPIMHESNLRRKIKIKTKNKIREKNETT
jgi:hypothetical protein